MISLIRFLWLFVYAKQLSVSTIPEGFLVRSADTVRRGVNRLLCIGKKECFNNIAFGNRKLNVGGQKQILRSTLILFLHCHFHGRFDRTVMSDPSLAVLTCEVNQQALTRRQRRIDLCFVIGVTLGQPIVASTAGALHPEMLRFGGTGNHVMQGIWMCLSGLAILFYVLWKRDAGIDTFGKLPQGADIFQGALLFAAAYLVISIAAITYSAIYRHFAGREPTEINIAAIYANRFQMLAIVFVFINPWYEELIVRVF
ncbi:MAG: hypothetical protein WBW03_26370 [Silvibacterium sp.]